MYSGQQKFARLIWPPVPPPPVDRPSVFDCDPVSAAALPVVSCFPTVGVRLRASFGASVTFSGACFGGLAFSVGSGAVISGVFCAGGRVGCTFGRSGIAFCTGRAPIGVMPPLLG